MVAFPIALERKRMNQLLFLMTIFNQCAQQKNKYASLRWDTSQV